MTSTLENSVTNPQWNYVENIGDGRGITFGTAGFTTGTYDGNILIHYYTTLNASNSLAKYPSTRCYRCSNSPRW
jgi:chitosanase